MHPRKILCETGLCFRALLGTLLKCVDNLYSDPFISCLNLITIKSLCWAVTCYLRTNSNPTVRCKSPQRSGHLRPHIESSILVLNNRWSYNPHFKKYQFLDIRFKMAQTRGPKENYNQTCLERTPKNSTKFSV